jgi:hypothetical protein
MKMKRNLILLGIVAVLAIALVIVAPKLKPTAKPTETPAATTDPALLTLCNTTSDKVSEVTVENPSQTYTVYIKDKKYYVKGQEDLSLDQSSAGGILSEAASVIGDRLIETDPKDLSVYGLDKPQAKVTAKYTDGTTIVFLLGNATAAGDTYYVMKQGDNKVVTISIGFATTYLATTNALITKEAFTLVQDDIESVKVVENGTTTLEMTSKSADANVTIAAWRISKPWNRSVDSTQLDTYLKAILAVTMQEVADGNPQDLSKYGLDKPKYDITISGKDKTNELLIGSDVDDSYTYAKFADGKTVYKVSKSSLSFTSTSAYVLMDKMILLVNITSAVGVEFKGLNTDGKMVITQTPSKDDSGAVKKDSNGKDVYDQTFSINGKAIEDKVARYYYQVCIGLSTHSLIKDNWQPSGDPVAVLTYTRNSDPTTITIEFMQYDDDFYAVRMDGGTYFLITKEKVQEVADATAKLVAGTLTAPANS